MTPNRASDAGPVAIAKEDHVLLDELIESAGDGIRSAGRFRCDDISAESKRRIEMIESAIADAQLAVDLLKSGVR